jgi:electron transfer flavoprotein alpha subunit
MANVFAFAETRGGELRKAGLEAVTAARQLADAGALGADGGGEVHAMVAGAPGVGSVAQRLAEHGADVVLVVEHPGLAQYDAESLTKTIAERVKAGGYRAAVFSATAQGKDLAPRVAARLKAPLAPDATSVSVDGDAIVAKHPMYTGKIIGTLRIASSPALVSVRLGAVTPAPNAKAGRVEAVQLAADPSASKVRVVELREGSKGKLDLGEAPVIVSGGRGLKAAENFKLVEDLADAFGNAAVGATRAVTDEGWRSHDEQIGQTGRVVSPQLYVAVGISGAIQHLAGMRTAKTIVAINKDKDAPIFKVADYGIVGDVFDVVPALTTAVKEAKAKG